MNKIPLISQSLLKRVQQYQIGTYCGLLLKHIWIDGNQDKTDSPEMHLGRYFEYMATGALDYDGNIPKAEFKGPPPQEIRDRISAARKWVTARSQRKTPGFGEPEWVKAKRQMFTDYAKSHRSKSTAYQIADQQAENWKRYCKEWGWTVKEVGKGWKDGDRWYTIDAVIEVAPGGMWPWDHCGTVTEWHSRHHQGREFICDLKFTGLINNKWEPFGFGGSIKDRHGPSAIQARHYSLSGLPVAFAVFGANKALECKIIPTLTEDPEGHLLKIQAAKNVLEAAILTGAWNAHPHYKRCRECPLKSDCEFKRLAPMPEQLEMI